MKDYLKRLGLGLLAAVMVTSASGCALLEFEDPSQLHEQEENGPVNNEQPIKPDPFELLDKDTLFLEEDLKNADGAVIATYKAAFPYFRNESENIAITKINQYYQDEFSLIEGDKERFFNIVTERDLGQVRSCAFSYTILDAPGDYIAVLRSYEGVDTLGADQHNYYCEVFNATTGWKLRFADIFGDRTEEAMKQLRLDIVDWCAEKDYAPNWLYHTSDDVVGANFAFDKDYIYVGLPAFTAPGGETLIQLPVDHFVELLGIQEPEA